MIAILHDYRKMTTAPKWVAGFAVLNQMIQSFRYYFGTELSVAKPSEIHCSNREWNRNSAFIMAQYEIAHSKQSAGELND